MSLKSSLTKPMSNLTIKAQLSLLSTFFVAMLLLSGAMGLFFLTQTVSGLKTVYEDRVVPIKQLRVVADMYAVNIVDTVHKVRDGALTKEQGLASIAQARTAIQTEWKAYVGTYLVPQETALIAKAKPLLVQADQAVDQAEALFKANGLDNQALLTAYAARDMYPKLDPLQGVISDLIQVQLDVAKATYDDGVVAFQKALFTVIGFAALSALIGGLLALRFTLKLTRELGAEPAEVNAMIHAVARGELFHDIPLRTNDNSSIAATVREMSITLRNMVQATRDNAESVAAASLQIAHGNHDLSNRTERQASALEETAASMEEMNSTVRLNADHAHEASQLAISACDMAIQGSTAVHEVEKTMKQINEASQHIAEIISVIDGIAFQTNILALNAAVEAARAGEQGRGFAVVASEVRALALRSTDAARQIKGLITSSGERVEQGEALATQAGAVMSDMLKANTHLANLMTDISNASLEQTAGVNQVSEAVASIDNITQQNAALVEESSAAAMNLQEQANALVTTVSSFQLQAPTSAKTPPLSGKSTVATAHLKPQAAGQSQQLSPWAGPERRSIHRAKNVIRPNFGSQASANTGSNLKKAV